MMILVTGAAGFIGSNFVYHMLKKHSDVEIVGLDALTYAGNLDNLSSLTAGEKERFQFIKGDINDREEVEWVFSEYDIRTVFNFAAETHVDRSIHDPQVFLKTNVLGTQTLLDVCMGHWRTAVDAWRAGRKFIQISTDEVYGSLGPEGLFSEETPLDPHSPYSASKAAADLMVKAYHDTYKMPVIISRSSNNYGPYQFPEKLIPLMLNNALNHKDLPVYGDGKQIRDWLYVEDHCRAIELIYQKGKPGAVYNVGGNNEHENMFIVKLIIRTLRELTGDEEINEDLIRHIQDRPGHDRRYGIDATRIREQLGWKPEVGFEDGIARTIRWYLDNREWTEKVVSGEYLEFYEKNYSGR
jgi:dTDP-glucose 4,6-dehydratase